MKKIVFLLCCLINLENRIIAREFASSRDVIDIVAEFGEVSQEDRKAPFVTEDNYLKYFDFKSLSPFLRKIFDEFIEDELPKGSTLKETLNENAGSRGKMRLAEALLLRNNKGDLEKAIEIIRWIFTLQNLDETSRDFAVWKGSINDKTYDQNMREFIGTDLIIVYHKYKTRFSAEFVADLEKCLIRTAKGDLMRNVDPDYNNISIMSSFMLEYIGTAFHLPEYKNAGIQKAKDIYANFLKYNTLCEYNSPTYYGVDFVGLALWRELSFSQEMKEMSKTLERELWLDVAEFYNANLQNICGPYLRSYGMDMKKYNAIIGVWIAAAIDQPEIATVPGRSGAHNETNFIVPILDLGISMPVKALNKFKQFDSERFIPRITSNYYEGDRLKKVTATIKKEWMMGGLWGNRKISRILKTGTIHWKSADGDIGWLCIPGEGKTNVQVDETQMKIFLADPKAETFEILVYSQNASETSFTDRLWSLLPMNLQITTRLKRAGTVVLTAQECREVIESDVYFPHLVRIVYRIPSNWNSSEPLLIINPKYNSR